VQILEDDFSDDRGCVLLPEVKRVVVLANMHSFKLKSFTLARQCGQFEAAFFLHFFEKRLVFERLL